jgi:hypothetical protein
MLILADTPAASALLSPIIQYGFAGFCAVLLAIIVWLVNKLLGVLRETNRIIEDNSRVIRKVEEQTAEEMLLLRSLAERLLTRPCLQKRTDEA